MTSFENGQISAMLFLNTIKDANLLCWNKKFIDEEYYDNFVNFENDFEYVFTKIEDDGKNVDNEEEKRKNLVFSIYVRYNYVVSHLEILNKLLKILVCQKPNLKFNEGTTLPQMITMICEKIKCSKQTIKITKESFYTDFRNAIAHHSFLISEHGITIHPNDIKKKMTYDIFDLQELNVHVKGLLSGFNEFAKTEANT